MIAVTLVSAALAAAQPQAAPMAGMDHAMPAAKPVKAEAKMGCCPCPEKDKAKPAS